MATFEDLLSVMNNGSTNPLGLSAEDALAATNRPLSKIEEKRQSVANKLAEKKAILEPQEPEVNYFDGGSGGGLLSLAGSSILRSGGNLADLGRGASNYLFGTEFDDSEDTGYSKLENADAAAGVSQGYRQDMQRDQLQVLQDIKDDNYWEATKSAANVALRTAADSANTIPELALGVAGTAVGGTAITANRYKKAIQAGENILETYRNMKPTKLGTVAKNVSQSSVMTANIVQQQRNEYKAENDGEEPSASRLAGMTLLTLATTAWTPAIVDKFYVPKLGRKKEDVDLKTQYMEEVKGYLDRADKGVIYQSAARIAEGIPKVAAAGGAEALQEYGQFWAEIIGTQLKPDEMGGFFEGIAELAANQDNLDEALQSAFLGGAAGGATRATASVPSLAAQATLDTGFKIGNGIRKSVSNQIDKQLSESDLLKKSAEAEIKAKTAEDLSDRNKANVATLNEAKTVEDITDEDLKNRVVRQAKDRDLTDEKTFNKVKNELARSMARETAAAKVDVVKTQATDTAVKVKDKAVESSKEILNSLGVTPETIEETVTKAKEIKAETAKKIKEEYENFPQSTTLALIEGLGNVAADAGSYSKDYLKKRAQMAGPRATMALAKAIEEDTPATAAKLRGFAKDMVKASRASNQRNDSLTTVDKLPTLVAKASATQKVDERAVNTTIGDILEVGKGEFADTATVKTVRQAIAGVKKSKAFSNLSGETQKSILDLDVELQKKAEDLTTIPESVANLSRKARNKVVPAIVNTGEAAYKKMVAALEKANTTVEEVVKDKPETTVEEATAKVDAAVETSSVEEQNLTDEQQETRAAQDTLVNQLSAAVDALSKRIDSTTNPDEKEQYVAQAIDIVANKFRTEFDAIFDNDVDAIRAYVESTGDAFKSPELSARLEKALKANQKGKATDEKTQTESTGKTQSSEANKATRKQFDNQSEKERQNAKIKTVTVDEDVATDFDNSTRVVKDGSEVEAYHNTPLTDEEIDDIADNYVDKSRLCDGKD